MNVQQANFYINYCCGDWHDLLLNSELLISHLSRAHSVDIFVHAAQIRLLTSAALVLTFKYEARKKSFEMAGREGHYNPMVVTKKTKQDSLVLILRPVRVINKFYVPFILTVGACYMYSSFRETHLRDEWV